MLLFRLTILVFPLLCMPPASADELTSEQNRIYRSPYFLLRGDTGISVADYEDAIFYNPAGIALGKGIYKRIILASPHVEFSQATKDLARQLGAEDADAVDTVRQNVGKPNHVGISNFSGILLRRVAIGAVVSGNVNLLASKSPDQGGLEVLEANVDQNTGLTFTVAESFWKGRMLLGATAKYIARGRGALSVSVAEAEEAKEKLKDREQFLGAGNGVGGDIGVMFRSKSKSRLNPAFGLTVNDVGDTKIIPEEDTDLDLDLKQTINVGTSIEPGTKYSKIRLLLDVRDVAGKVEKNDRKKVHIGTELTFRDVVGITTGLHHGYPTMGMYVDLYFFRLDAGMYTYEAGDRVGTRPDTRFIVRLSAGF